MRYFKNLFLIALIILLSLTGCKKDPTNAVVPKNNPFDENTYSYIVNLNELPEGFKFCYKDAEYINDSKELDYVFSNKDEVFIIKSGDYEQEYCFFDFRKEVKIPLELLIKKQVRANTPVEFKTPPPHDYRLMIPSGITVEYNNEIFIGSDKEVLISDVFYEDGFTVKTKDFIKRFYFQSFDKNCTIDIGELTCYALLSDVKVTKQTLGYQVELPKQLADFKVNSVNSENYLFTISYKGSIIAFIDNNLYIEPTVYPKHIKTYISDDGHYYTYIEDKYLVIRDKNGKLKTRAYFGGFNITGEGLHWSPNNKYIFCAILVSKNPNKDKFYLFNTEDNSFIALGGDHKNYYSNVKWSRDSSKIAFYKVENGYSEDHTGEYIHYDISNNILSKLGGGHRDTIDWVNNEPVLNRHNNGLRFEIFDSVRNEFASKYEGYCDPQYPKDFVGSLIKIYDENDKELASIDIFDILKQNNIQTPEDIDYLLPGIATYNVNRYLYFSICWEPVSAEDRLNGILPNTNVIGFIDLKTLKLHHIMDISHLEYYRNRSVFNYTNTYKVNYYDDYSILFFKGSYIEVFDIEAKTTEVYRLPKEFNNFKLHKNKLIIYDIHSLKVIDPKRITTVIASDLELNYTYINDKEILITTSDSTDTHNINTFYRFNLDKLVQSTSVEDIEAESTSYGTKIKILNDKFNIIWDNYGGKNLKILNEQKIVGHISSDMNIHPINLPDKHKAYISDDRKQYAYLDEEGYLVISNYKGEILSNTYLGSNQIKCDKLVWSPNNKFIFCSFYFDKVSDKANFNIFSIEDKKLIPIGGTNKNYFDRISWSPDNTAMCFFMLTPTHCEDGTGSYVYFLIEEKKLVELGGTNSDRIVWSDSSPTLIKLNNGVKYDLYDPIRDEHASQHMGIYDPHYPKDFMATIVKVFDENNNVTLSFDILELIKQQNISVPEDLTRFAPEIWPIQNNKYLCFRNSWNPLTEFESPDGNATKPNLYGIIDLESKVLHSVIDISDYDYKYSFNQFVKPNTFEYDYVNNCLYLFNENNVEVFNLLLNETKTYYFPPKTVAAKLYENWLFVIIEDALLIISPDKIEQEYDLGTVNNHVFNYHNQLLIDTNNTNGERVYYIFDLANCIQ